MITFTAVMHGTKTRAESWDVANCIGLPACRRTVSKFTSVLQPDSTSHNLNLESEPEIQMHRERLQFHFSVVGLRYILNKKGSVIKIKKCLAEETRSLD